MKFARIQGMKLVKEDMALEKKLTKNFEKELVENN